MSAEYQGRDPLEIAREVEKDLNSSEAKQGHAGSDSTIESGIDESVTNKFPGSTTVSGSAASGAGDNREIPLEEGGDIQKGTGRVTKARDFEGPGGPETKRDIHANENPGADDVTENVRNNKKD